MKLKTLNDLRYWGTCYGGEEDNPQIIFKEELKAEAIKWRKLRREQSMNIAEEDWDAFFNITEEDLK